MATKKLPTATRLALLKRTPEELEKDLRRVSRARDREYADHQAEMALTEERLRLLLEVYWAADWLMAVEGQPDFPRAHARLTVGLTDAKKVLDKRATPAPKGKVPK